MTKTPDQLPTAFMESREAFLRALSGKNRSEATLRAYRTDIGQFIGFLVATNICIDSPTDVVHDDVMEYLAHLGQRGISGVTRARKLAALREYFRYLHAHGAISSSPLEHVDTPKKERTSRTYLRAEEYTKLLSLAGGNARDFAIFQTFLQTGIRVSELCSLTLSDIDLPGAMLFVREGKGKASREIALEKKAIQALKGYLAVRPESGYEELFLNRDGQPLGQRGVRKLVAKYKKLAGITKKMSCHSLRHTFATAKAERGVSPYQLQQWLGHRNLNTTQIYVHLGKQNAKKVMEATSL